DHLEHHADLSGEIRSLISYGDSPAGEIPRVYFPASETNLDLRKVLWIDEIPVLYPVSDVKNAFYSFQDHHLVFHHDLLKSVFHLLSGYEEVKNGASDQYGRFPYKESLQFKLGIIRKPIVNYYFEIILEGLEEFCIKNGISFQRNTVFSKPVLMLSHDIDRLDAYHFFETAFKFKQLFGLAESPYNLSGKIRDAFSALYHFLNPFSNKNPFWSFDTLMKWESDRGFKSTYYFLEKEGGRHTNSRYHFHEKRIRKLLRNLSAQDHEIGIHGTIQSSTDQDAMDRTVRNLQEASPDPVVGIRQHFLKFKLGETAQIQEKAGLQYDASLGFAEHEGFRNSYCWPFRIYDFKNECRMDLWEIPLTVMEGTLF
ncbi:MAG: hypothetical protein KAT15_20560, partial [Bacteroidales bacterium]|nr:hypothetical protein [Bacteroidales bacterium]